MAFSHSGWNVGYERIYICTMSMNLHLIIFLLLCHQCLVAVECIWLAMEWMFVCAECCVSKYLCFICIVNIFGVCSLVVCIPYVRMYVRLYMYSSELLVSLELGIHFHWWCFVSDRLRGFRAKACQCQTCTYVVHTKCMESVLNRCTEAATTSAGTMVCYDVLWEDYTYIRTYVTL